MRNLSGVTLFYPEFLQGLKQQALLFDTFYVYGLDSIDYLNIPAYMKADVEFLMSKGILRELPMKVWIDVDKEAHASEDYKKLIQTFDNATVNSTNLAWDHDYFTRIASAKMAAEYYIETAPICQLPLPTELFGHSWQRKAAKKEVTLRVSLDALPVPDGTSSWQDILDFRTEMSDKQWDFRRFLHTLSTTKQSKKEIEDDIEWRLREYRNAMKVHRMNSSQGAVDVYLVSPLEIIEDLAKFQWSRLAKNILSVSKRQVELLEAEMNANGRECAYIFEAQRRFGNERN
jgi:hypothetical protein